MFCKDFNKTTSTKPALTLANFYSSYMFGYLLLGGALI